MVTVMELCEWFFGGILFADNDLIGGGGMDDNNEEEEENKEVFEISEEVDLNASIVKVRER